MSSIGMIKFKNNKKKENATSYWGAKCNKDRFKHIVPKHRVVTKQGAYAIINLFSRFQIDTQE